MSVATRRTIIVVVSLSAGFGFPFLMKALGLM